MNPPAIPADYRPTIYEWDHWECLALERGLAPDLATLGRSLMREAHQHGWCARLKAECGWNDEGRAMLARLLAHPCRAAARLEWLYATDGLRFDPWKRNEHDEDSPCWKSMRQRWNREQQREAQSSSLTANR
jgi:hypothetical protein